MDIRIMDCRTAIAYTPTRPTLVIRILDSYYEEIPIPPLRPSQHYTICSYVFDDQDPGLLARENPDFDFEQLKRRQTVFDPNMAEQVLGDFERLRSGKLELLVHCSLGASRSPAVAMALNGIFGLGADDRALRERYPDHNRHVYRTLIETAQLRGFTRQAHPVVSQYYFPSVP